MQFMSTYENFERKRPNCKYQRKRIERESKILQPKILLENKEQKGEEVTKEVQKVKKKGKRFSPGLRPQPSPAPGLLFSYSGLGLIPLWRSL